MIEKQVGIPAKDGSIDTFICHPERRGPWPAIIFYMDAPGIREELRDMARRLGTVGYYVLLPNLYYRAGAKSIIDTGALAEGSPERKRMFDLMQSLTNTLIAEDTAHLLAFMEQQREIRKGPAGCVGYCMSGQFVVTVAGRFPDRFAAAASVYGVGLMTDRPDSPHLLARDIKSEIYFACAETDRYAPLSMIGALKTEFERAGVNFEIEMFRGAEHGFAFPQRHCYNKPAAETHWERLFDLFRRRLG